MTRRTEPRNSMMARGVTRGKLKGKGQVTLTRRPAPQIAAKEAASVFFLSQITKTRACAWVNLRGAAC